MENLKYWKVSGPDCILQDGVVIDVKTAVNSHNQLVKQVQAWFEKFNWQQRAVDYARNELPPDAITPLFLRSLQFASSFEAAQLQVDERVEFLRSLLRVEDAAEDKKLSHSAEIVMRLEKLMPPEMVQTWLKTPNDRLGGMPPSHLLDKGKVEPVLKLISRME